MLVRLSQFSGIIPRSDPHLLPPSAAVVAENCKMVSGNLRPWKNPVTVNTPTKAGVKKTIYLYEGSFWLSWTQDVDVAKRPLSNDSFKRLYWTGEGTPKMSTYDLITTGGTDYPHASYDLGIPAPVDAPTLALGPDWTENSGLPSSGKWSVTFGNGVFVAVKYNSAVAATSTDGVTWTPRTLSATANWNAITFGNGLFVTVASASTAASTSPDGITWTPRVLSGFSPWSGIAYGNGIFVAVAAGTAGVATSPDGITWTDHTTPNAPDTICYGSGIFVGKLQSADVASTSPDGITWTRRSLPASITVNVNATVFGNGVFVFFGTGSNTAITSTDGIIWVVRTLPSVQSWTAAAFGDGIFVALASGSNVVVSSVDLGATWSLRSTVTAGTWYSATFGLTKFISVTSTSSEVGILSSIDQTKLETRSYVYRYLSSYGEVGMPSPASVTVDVWPGQTVVLSGMDGAPAGNYNIASIEIYRTNTGSTTTAFQYVATIAVGTTTYTDSIALGALGEVLNSLLWSMPPSDLAGLITLPNGSLCGYSGSQLCFSVPYQPQAWPVNQRYPLFDAIMGIKSYGMNVLATTVASPYAVTIGSDLTVLQPQKLESGYACVSKRGVVEMSGTVAYPEPNGLMLAGVNGVQLITAQVLDKDSWAALDPATISAYYYGGLYIAFTDLGCFAFNIGSIAYNTAGNASFVDQTLVNITGIPATAGYHDPATGNLYLAVGTNIQLWDGATTYMTYVWKSRPFVSNSPVNMSCGRVFADAYPVTFKLYVDGALKSTASVADDKPFRLPTGYRGKEFAVQMEGTYNIFEVFLSDSMSELRRS
jgi:hypothetical protein